MRLFITSYNKSGTHQIMPMVNDRSVSLINIVERSQLAFSRVKPVYGGVPRDWQGPSDETIKDLTEFPHRAFGHLAYDPAYAEALQAQPTKVLFNVRDPRDVVIAEYENIRRHRAAHREGWAWLDMDFFEGSPPIRLGDTKDPISHLIWLASERWPVWLGWMKHEWVRVVHYEDLRLRPEQTVHEISEWLAPCLIPAESSMVANLRPKPRNPTFRKGAVGEWKKYFTPALTKLAEDKLGAIIAALGYPMEGYHAEVS